MILLCNIFFTVLLLFILNELLFILTVSMLNNTTIIQNKLYNKVTNINN
jgi:hypothetical protein